MTRGVRQPNGNVRQMEDVPSLTDLTDFGAAMVVTTEPQTFLDGLFYVSGEIPRVTAFERGFPGQMRRTADGAGKSWMDSSSSTMMRRGKAATF